MSTTRPSFQATLGPVSSAVFEHESDGNGTPRLSISLRRRFFDRKAEEWKTSVCYLTPETLSAAIAVLKAIENTLLEVQSNEA